MMMMKTELGENQLTIPVSVKRLICLVAKSALVTMLILPFPLLLSIISANSELKDNGLLLNSDNHAESQGNSFSLFTHFSKKANLISPSPKLEPIVHGSPSRRLLSVPEVKKETLDGLEDVLLEPPIGSRKLKSSKRIRFLSNLIGESLDNYPRRVYIDVDPPERANSESWFKKNYPKGKLDFEMVRLDIIRSQKEDSEAQRTSDWLRANVKKEDYVVMKAEAGEVEEMIAGRAVGLVDELFLECKNQWFKGKKSKRAYWECLALYGRLRDEGVAVHQWWG